MRIESIELNNEKRKTWRKRRRRMYCIVYHSRFNMANLPEIAFLLNAQVNSYTKTLDCLQSACSLWRTQQDSALIEQVKALESISISMKQNSEKLKQKTRQKPQKTSKSIAISDEIDQVTQVSKELVKRCKKTSLCVSPEIVAKIDALRRKHKESRRLARMESECKKNFLNHLENSNKSKM